MRNRSSSWRVRYCPGSARSPRPQESHRMQSVHHATVWRARCFTTGSGLRSSFSSRVCPDSTQPMVLSGMRFGPSTTTENAPEGTFRRPTGRHVHPPAAQCHGGAREQAREMHVPRPCGRGIVDRRGLGGIRARLEGLELLLQHSEALHPGRQERQVRVSAGKARASLRVAHLHHGIRGRRWIEEHAKSRFQLHRDFCRAVDWHFGGEVQARVIRARYHERMGAGRDPIDLERGLPGRFAIHRDLGGTDVARHRQSPGRNVHLRLEFGDSRNARVDEERPRVEKRIRLHTQRMLARGEIRDEERGRSAERSINEDAVRLRRDNVQDAPCRERSGILVNQIQRID